MIIYNITKSGSFNSIYFNSLSEMRQFFFSRKKEKKKKRERESKERDKERLYWTV